MHFLKKLICIRLLTYVYAKNKVRKSRPQRNVINFPGLVAEVYINSGLKGSSGVEGGLVLTQSHRDADIWMFGYMKGDYQGLMLLEITKPRHNSSMITCLDDKDVIMAFEKGEGMKFEGLSFDNGEEPVRLSNISLYDEVGDGMKKKGRALAFIAYSLRPENASSASTASVMVPKACGIIHQPSKVSKKALVLHSSLKAVIVTQEGPWASPNLDVHCENKDTTVSSGEKEEKFSLYANNRRKCLTIKEIIMKPLAEGQVIIRGAGDHKVKGHLQLVQEASDQPVQIVGEVVGLSEGQHGFHVHEFGSTGNNCLEAGGHFNLFDREPHVGDLGNIFANANHTAFVDITDAGDLISLVGPHSIMGRTIVIHEDPDAGARVACGLIQEVKEVTTSAQAVIEGDNVKGQINLLQQQGIGDFVHVSGFLNGLDPKADDYELIITPTENTLENTTLSLVQIQDVIDNNDTKIELDVVAFIEGLGITDVNDSSSLIGQSISIQNTMGMTLGYGLIERIQDLNLPLRCTLPSISLGQSCPLSDFAWSYEVNSRLCRIVNTAGCAYATENQFATEAECKRTCAEEIDLEITLLPTPKVLGNFLAKVKLKRYLLLLLS